MKKILIMLFAINLLIANAYATSFIDGFEDIPLVEGFRQINNQNFSFGNEEGGYTEAVLWAKKGKTFNDVIQFYVETLPKLGWGLKNKSDKALVFTRDNNTLEILRQETRPLKVRISLKSRN